MVWKDIKDYEGLYQINELGEIKRLPYIQSHPYRIGYNMNFKGGILKQSFDRDGYKLITIWKNNKSKTYRVHRLVTQAFIPNPNNKPEVNHINGIKDDNRVENLEWSTSKENINHSIQVLNKVRNGNLNSNSKLTEKDIICIRKDNRIHKTIAIEYGVARTTITGIKNNRTWKK